MMVRNPGCSKKKVTGWMMGMKGGDLGDKKQTRGNGVLDKGCR